MIQALNLVFDRVSARLVPMGQPLTIDIPWELLRVIGTEEEARQEAMTALILDLVRRGKVSRARAAEFLQIPLADFPAFLSQYQIPWFDYSTEILQEDLRTVASHPPTPSA
jgi:predicted HTH domain antitoxin